jgi:nitrogen fixation protein FixH
MEDIVPARNNHWPLLIIILIAGFLALTAWSFFRAARGASAVTDSDYYRHGLRFEQTLLEQKAASSLGWAMQTALDNRQLRVQLQDRRQQPVTAAHAELIMPVDRHGEPLRLPLREEPAGVYCVQLPATWHGEQIIRIDFERDGAHLSKQLILSLP